MSIIQLGIEDYIPVRLTTVMYYNLHISTFFGARSYAPGNLTEVSTS